MPTCCPLGVDGAGGCVLWVHDERHRKTGPAHALSVVRCRTHGASFTLYPPGYAPYRRQALLRLSPSGVEVEADGREYGDFEGTLFEAALDAREGRGWARESATAIPDRWWGTQGRHLRLAARLLGLDRELGERVREKIAATVSVAALTLREYASATGYRAIGEAVCAVLSRISGGARRSFTLLVCGRLIGKWGEPLWWDDERQVMQRSPFLVEATSCTT